MMDVHIAISSTHKNAEDTSKFNCVRRDVVPPSVQLRQVMMCIEQISNFFKFGIIQPGGFDATA